MSTSKVLALLQDVDRALDQDGWRVGQEYYTRSKLQLAIGLIEGASEGPTLGETRAKWGRLYLGKGHMLAAGEAKRFEEFLNPPQPSEAEKVVLEVLDNHRGALRTNLAKDAVVALKEAGLLKED